MWTFENQRNEERKPHIFNFWELILVFKNSFTVYAHINKINGKIYVGITKRSVEERWNNGYGYIGCSYFYNAIQKYGWDNFDHIIIASNLTEEEASNYEIELIEECDLRNPDYGYNLKSGGYNNYNDNRVTSDELRKKLSEAHKGHKHTPEQTRKIVEKNTGKKRSKEFCEVMSKLKSGQNHHYYGKKLPEEQVRKSAEGLRKYYQTHPMLPHGEKKILCVETGIIYRSIEAAAKDLNICRSAISECAAGKRRHTAGGYHWQFVSETLETTERAS